VKILLELSMECEPLAISEALAACEALGGEAKVLAHEPGVLVVETRAEPQDLAGRLGLCHYVCEWLFSCSPKELESFSESIEVPGPIRIRSTKVGDAKVDLASISRQIGAIVGRSRGVSMQEPRTDIRIVFSKTVHVGRVLAAVDRSSFEKRKNLYMPFFYPASLHPKYARALVNLSRVRTREMLLDPFCGTGAIVAEAALVGIRAVGTDISPRMIEGAGRNLGHLGLEARLLVCDIGEVHDEVGHVDGVATDPPYGKSTSTYGEGIPDLYVRAFESFSSVLGKGATVAIVVPSLTLLKGLEDFRLVEHHGLRVHRSLTRHFCVLRRV
jgi:tRNA (guanine10-N2)-dimethyltransferase